jgi:hypothetical protein
MPVPNFFNSTSTPQKTNSNVPNFFGGADTKTEETSGGVPNFFEGQVAPPVVEESKMSKLKGPNFKAIGDFISGAAEEPTYTGKGFDWLKNLPNEIVRTILPGAAAIKDNEEEFGDISNWDIAKEVPGVVRDMFVEPILSYPATFYGMADKYINKPLGLSAPPGISNRETGAVDAKLPIIGNISNVQQRAEEDMESKGKVPETPLEITAFVAKHTGFEILNGLFAASMASKIVNPRVTKLTPKDTYTPKDGRFPKQPGPKSFQLFENVYRDPIPASAFDKIVKDRNIPVRTNYNPKNPIFFQTTKILPDGTATGQFFQVRPSFWNTFLSKFGRDITKLPQNQIVPITGTMQGLGPEGKAPPPTPTIAPPTVVTPPKPTTTPKPPVIETPPKPPVVETPPPPTTSPVVTPTVPPSKPATLGEVAAGLAEIDIKGVIGGAKKALDELRAAIKKDVTTVPDDKLIALYNFDTKFAGGYPEIASTDLFKELVNRGYTLKDPKNVQGGFKPKKTSKSDTVDVVPAPKPDAPIELPGGNKVTPPKQLVTKTQVKDLINAHGGKVEFTVEGTGDHSFLTYKDAKTDMRIRPKALGLVTDNLKPGQTVRITSDNLKKSGTGFRGVDSKGTTVAKQKPKKPKKKSLPSKDGGIKAPKHKPQAQTKDDIIKAIEQLNKFGQSQAILRKTGGVSKKAYGHFKFKGKGIPANKKGKVELRDDTAADPRNYMETLAHELAHALDYNINGKAFNKTLEIFGKDLTKKQSETLMAELKEVTHQLVGKEVAMSKPSYYYYKPELFARFLETMFAKPGTLESIAPTAVDLFDAAKVKNPIIAEFLEAVAGTIDKGELKHILARDMRQTYMKYLGTRNGNQAWDQYINYRAMKERAKFQIGELLESKFKKNLTIAGIKMPIKLNKITDSPELIFDSIESIRITKNDVPEFGTRDMLYAKDKAEIAKLEEMGYEPLKGPDGKTLLELVDGEQYPRYAKLRYTPEQGKSFYDALSIEGKALVRDFTAQRADAKDYFNREIIKDVHKIDSKLEGWVHRYWDDKAFGMGGDKLKLKTASSRRFRKGQEGYVKDLEKAMSKSLVELETEKAYNHFMKDFFPRVTRPLAKGAEPDKGWVEVFGDVSKGGVGLGWEVNKKVIIKDGKSIPVQQPRYQMPKEVYEQFKLMRGVAEEAATATRIVSSVMRYWRVNILFHMGSNATNFISGGIQQSANMVNHFYKELLTGQVTFPQFRSDVFSLLSTVTPRGWQNAPDWIYGGDTSNLYGQFSGDVSPGIKALDDNIDAYADKALKVYGTVERYWKKVIVNAHNTNDLRRLNTITKEGLKLPTAEEEALIAAINREADQFALDYDNIPTWLANYKKSAGIQSVKPFAVFVYKINKQFMSHVENFLDGTKSLDDRLAAILTLGTMLGAIGYRLNENKKESTVPAVGENAPSSQSSAGQYYLGTNEDGTEKFTRVGKYPYVNLAEAGLQLADGNSAEAWKVMSNMIGSVGPGGDVSAAILGYKSEYQMYMTPDVIAGQSMSMFVPASRILADIAAYKDPHKRKITSFTQGFTRLYPTSNPELQDKLHGDKRIISLPLEGNVYPSGDFFEKPGRTTTDKYLLNYKNDILFQALSGIYIKRIDPDVAEAFNIREEANVFNKEQKFDPFGD